MIHLIVERNIRIIWIQEGCKRQGNQGRNLFLKTRVNDLSLSYIKGGKSKIKQGNTKYSDIYDYNLLSYVSKFAA